MSAWSKFPVAMPEGGLMPHMSARMRTETMDALFYGAGGFDRALAWINANDENYGDFFKLWARGAVRSTNVELTADNSVEAMLARLDSGEFAKVINPEPGDGATIEPEPIDAR